MKKYLLFWVLLVHFQCKEENARPISAKNQEDTFVKGVYLYINYNDISHLTYDKLMDSLSKIPLPNKKIPYSQETFIIGDDNGAVSEFRMGLLNFYSEEEINRKDIFIKEVNWEISPTHNLTIWYERKNREWKPINHIIWDKTTEF